MYLAIIALPLLSATVAGFLGRKIGRTGSHLITCSSLVLTALLALVAFYEVGLCQSPVSVKLMSWIDSESLLCSRLLFLSYNIIKSTSDCLSKEVTESLNDSKFV